MSEFAASWSVLWSSVLRHLSSSCAASARPAFSGHFRASFIDITAPCRTITIHHEKAYRIGSYRTFAVVLDPKKRAAYGPGPAFPEIVTYGKDEREALAMAEDAIRLVLEDCAARGEPIPGGEPPRIREVTVILAA